MTAERNEALIDRMYKAMNENRVGVMKAFWTEDMIWCGPVGVGTHYGVEAFENNVRKPFIRAFPDEVGQGIVCLAEAEYVAGTGYQDSTFAEDWLGIPASGKKARVR